MFIKVFSIRSKKCKKHFTELWVTKSKTNKYIIPVIETNGENHKENDECK